MFNILLSNLDEICMAKEKYLKDSGNTLDLFLVIYLYFYYNNLIKESGNK